MKRRIVLRTVLASAAVAAGALLPGFPQVVAAAAGQRPTPGGGRMDPNFASGTVIALEPSGMIVGFGSGQRAIRTFARTTFWKETRTGFASVELGDTVYAAGVGQPDGTVDATSVWVNIGRFDGYVEATRPGGLVIRTAARQHHWDIEFSPHLEFVGPSGTPAAGGVPDFAPGQRVSGVVVRLRDGRRRATRIWLS